MLRRYQGSPAATIEQHLWVQTFDEPRVIEVDGKRQAVKSDRAIGLGRVIQARTANNSLIAQGRVWQAVIEDGVWANTRSHARAERKMKQRTEKMRRRYGDEDTIVASVFVSKEYLDIAGKKPKELRLKGYEGVDTTIEVAPLLLAAAHRLTKAGQGNYDVRVLTEDQRSLDAQYFGYGDGFAQDTNAFQGVARPGLEAYSQARAKGHVIEAATDFGLRAIRLAVYS